MIRFILLLLLIAWIPSFSQYVVRIDSSLTRNVDKSLPVAIVLSAALPGMGEYYLGEKQKVKPHLWVEMFGWGAVAITYFTGESYLQSAQGFAEKHAGVIGAPADPTFLDLMSRYRSRAGVAGQNSSADPDEDYNLSLIREGREVDEVYPWDEAHTWDWGSSENLEATAHMREFNHILQNYRMARISFQIAAGVVVLNRLISVLDVVRIHRETSVKTLSFVPYLAPEVQGASLVMGF